MIIMTTEGPYEVWAQTRTSLDRVVLASTSLQLLESVVASIELAGASEDEDSHVGEFLHPRPETWTVELDRTTFKIWLNFEVDHYLKYGKKEFPEAATLTSGTAYGTVVDNVMRETGLE